MNYEYFKFKLSICAAKATTISIKHLYSIKFYYSTMNLLDQKNNFMRDSSNFSRFTQFLISVRDGLLYVGLNTEMQVFSQWSPFEEQEYSDSMVVKEKRTMVPKNHSVMDLNKSGL